MKHANVLQKMLKGGTVNDNLFLYFSVIDLFKVIFQTKAFFPL